MTSNILFASSEMGGFLSFAAANITSDEISNDDTYSRAGVRVQGTGRQRVYYSQEQTSGWIRFVHYPQLEYGTSTRLFVAFSSADTSVLRLRTITAGTNNIIFERSSDGSAWTSIGTYDATALQLQNQLDFHWKASTTAGNLQWYLGNESKGSYSGDTSGFKIKRYEFAGAGGDNRYSENIAAKIPTVGWRLGTLAPSLDSSVANWNGSVGLINETSTNDLNGIYTSVTGASHFFALGSLTSVAQTGVVKAVIVVARARKDSANGPQNIETAIRVSGVEYYATSASGSGGGTILMKSGTSLDIGFQPFIGVWDNNPKTGNPWQISDLASIQAGVRALA